MSTTLKAMKRIQEIKQKREQVFYKKRMQGRIERERNENLKLVEKNIELLDTPELVQKVLENKQNSSPAKMDMEVI
jgi:large subunit ribosomal protein L24e